MAGYMRFQIVPRICTTKRNVVGPVPCNFNKSIIGVSAMDMSSVLPGPVIKCPIFLSRAPAVTAASMYERCAFLTSSPFPRSTSEKSSTLKVVLKV